MTPSGQLINRLPNVSSLILLPYTFVYFYLKKTVLLGSNVTFPDKFKKKTFIYTCYFSFWIKSAGC